MGKKIILVLAQKKFYIIDKYKFEVEAFKQKNVEIQLHELVDFITPKISNSFQNRLKDECIISFNAFSQWYSHLKDILKKFKKEDIFIFNFILPHNFYSVLINFILKKKFKLQVIEFSGDDAPNWEQPITDKILDINIFLNAVLQFFKHPKKIRIFAESKIFAIIAKILRLKPKYYLVFGKKDLIRLNNAKKNNIILGNSLDQNLFLVEKKRLSIIDNSYSYALFLESATPIFNGDNELLGVDKDAVMSVKNWTNSLKNFFDFIEMKLRLKVVISPHPRVKHLQEYPDYYYGRKVLSNFAYTASKNAKLIITRLSTGISNGILNNIPIMIIYSDEIKKNRNMLSQSFYISNKLGKKPINIDNFDKDKFTDEAYKVDDLKYKNYKKNYLTLRNDDKKNSEVLLDIMNKKISKI